MARRVAADGFFSSEGVEDVFQIQRPCHDASPNRSPGETPTGYPYGEVFFGRR